MKKYFVILLLLLIDIFLYTDKTKLSSQSINLDLQKDELALTIFSLDNSKSILINKSELLMLEYIDSLDLEKMLNIYGINVLKNIISNNNYTVDLKSYDKKTIKDRINLNNISIIKKENIEVIKYYDYSFCVYKKGNNKDLTNCDFIYFLNIDNLDFSDDVLAVFFDSDIDKEVIEKYYDKWVDSYILNDKTLYTLKMSPYDYEVIEVPIN